MSAEKKRTLREAHLTLEALIDNVATLLEVVADDDMPDAYGDHTLESMFTKQVGERFATQLVYRLLHDDEIAIDWVGAIGPDRLLGIRDQEDDDAPLVSPPTLDDVKEYERQRAIEHATSLRTGDEVQHIGKKPRGVVAGRDASDPTRLQVRWYGSGKTIWENAAELRKARPLPADDEPDQVATEYPTDPMPEEDGPMLTEPEEEAR